MVALVNRLIVTDDGQDLLEYGLLAVLIAIFAMAALTQLGGTVNTILWQPIASTI
jgi:Flp pilus assembly pilin Flp